MPFICYVHIYLLELCFTLCRIFIGAKPIEYCEELNNSQQIQAATDGRPLTRYAANSRSNGAARRVWRLGWRTREFGDQGWRAKEFGDQGWRTREFGDQGWRAREFGDQGWRSRDNEDFACKARVPCTIADNGTPPNFGLFRELWTGRRSATSRQWSGTQACHKHHGNQRDGSSGRSIDRKRYVKDKWVNQEARTLDPEWRDPSGHAQKGNKGSRRPYIRPQSAGRWISRSQGVKPSRSIRYQSEQSNNQIIYKQVESAEKQRRGSLRGARLLRRDVRDWDTRNLRIETQVAEVQRASHG